MSTPEQRQEWTRLADFARNRAVSHKTATNLANAVETLLREVGELELRWKGADDVSAKLVDDLDLANRRIEKLREGVQRVQNGVGSLSHILKVDDELAKEKP